MNADRHPADERFDAALREWAGRPAPTLPARAARRLAAAVPQRRPAVSWWRPVATALAVLLVGIAVALLARHAPPSRQAARALAPPPLDDDVVVQWLDPDTPVYFVLPPQARSKGGLS